MNDRKAILLGATGLIGKELLLLLLRDDYYSEVAVYARRPIDLKHPRLSIQTGDLLDDDFYSGRMHAASIFCCIGTTQSKTPDLSIYKKIDYGIPVQAARVGAAEGARQFLVVSAMGAKVDSRIFYNHTKGHMEEAVLNSGIPEIYIFRPSLLLGQRKEFRLMERVGKVFFTVFQRLLPRRYRGIHARTVARAMLAVAKNRPDQQIFLSDQIQKWGTEP